MKKYLILVLGTFLGLSESVNAVKTFKGCVKEERQCMDLCCEGKDMMKSYIWDNTVKRNDTLCEAAPQTPHGCYCNMIEKTW